MQCSCLNICQIYCKNKAYLPNSPDSYEPEIILLSRDEIREPVCTEHDYECDMCDTKYGVQNSRK